MHSLQSFLLGTLSAPWKVCILIFWSSLAGNNELSWEYTEAGWKPLLGQWLILLPTLALPSYSLGHNFFAQPSAQLPPPEGLGKCSFSFPFSYALVVVSKCWGGGVLVDVVFSLSFVSFLFQKACNWDPDVKLTWWRTVGSHSSSAGTGSTGREVGDQQQVNRPISDDMRL